MEASLEWAIRTSPPTNAEGLVRAISDARDLAEQRILVGPGSSALIFLALGQWLTKQSRVLLIEPSYGEYEHYCRNVAVCGVDIQLTHPSDGFILDLDRWSDRLTSGLYDLAVLVNPNNPCGTSVSLSDLRRTLLRVPARCRVLIDEAYIDYTSEASAETILSEFPNLYVVKSMSKGFALSGLRVGYLAGNVDGLRPLTPPWWVSLPAQIAAVTALTERAYYANCYRETAILRSELDEALQGAGCHCIGAANWLLCRLPKGQSATSIVESAQSQGIFLRNSGLTAPSLGDEWIRVAVRTRDENRRIGDCLSNLLVGHSREVPLANGSRTS